ncbi:hypothetical protein Hypma_009994 [Hypsizygus marmoreus]|uniref:Uncharacterized protein n=1 Tax=Hypsizygus marmoreus TaxID=39966 RepID=A0A369JKZ3_HYPMA|nr:hypothetical protein Hypma_009994 [Hypsizygus marmoreus]
MSLADVRSRLLRIASYVANGRFLALIGWRREGMGNVLVAKKTGEKLVCVIVGQIIDERLSCGPIGNFVPGGPFPKPLDAAKYTFLLGRPLDPDFANDFDQAVRTIKNWEGAIAMTDDRRYFIDVVGKEPVLKFSAAVFEKRDVALQPGIDQVDDESENWPIPAAHSLLYNSTKYTHRVVPLPVYDVDRQFVDCIRANSALRDAVVEVHFTVKHYGIRREPAYDSFSGVAQQILILKVAPGKKTNRYQVDFRRGPVNIEVFVDDVTDEIEVPSPTSTGTIIGDPIDNNVPDVPVAGPSNHANALRLPPAALTPPENAPSGGELTAGEGGSELDAPQKRAGDDLAAPPAKKTRDNKARARA